VWAGYLLVAGLAVGLYPYVLYPLLAALIARLRPRPVRRSAQAPRVSILISAYNEARHIEATVRNKLALAYAGELEVLVASDGSTDGTDDIVRRLAAEDSRVSLHRQEPRAGKTAALNDLVSKAKGEILVFSDANSLYDAEALRHLTANFADPAVGYVTGRMIYINPDGTPVGDGNTAYMRYENSLRATETALGSVVGVDGGVDAVRRALYRPMRPDQLPDFVLPLDVVAQGYRVVYEPGALLTEEALAEGGAEYRMRVRVALRALWALHDRRALLLGAAGGLFAWQLWSHKLLRYLSFVPFAIAWTAGLLGTVNGASPGLVVLFALYNAVLLLALAGAAGLSVGPARYAFYFLLLNLASARATWRYLRGEKQVLWQPRVG
jgi:cellulose synthase/poly-beta-1,6-N-acetylglucosamine synthase-like glycosyltransferase